MRNIPQKGDHGYTDAHKKAQLFKTFVFFLLPAVIFLIGYVTTKTRLNLFTVVAVVGCLPACKELVNVILFCRRRSIPRELYEELERHTESLEHAYELILTTYEKNYPIHSLVIRGNEIVGYSTMKNTDLKPVEAHVTKVLKENGISGVHVHVFTELKAYLDRVDALSKKEPEDIPFTPDARYPSLNREQLIRGVILALSL